MPSIDLVSTVQAQLLVYQKLSKQTTTHVGLSVCLEKQFECKTTLNCMKHIYLNYRHLHGPFLIYEPLDLHCNFRFTKYANFLV